MGARPDKFEMATGRSGSPIPDGADAHVLQNDLRWQVAERAAHSQSIGRATQLRLILLYLVQQTILQPEESIHEFDIAHSVLGRQDDFNPLDDNIVRVQMTRLRKRLEIYFLEEGKNEQIVISIATGSYQPVFINRAKLLPAPLPEGAASSHNEDGPSGEQEAAGSPAVVELPEKSVRRSSAALFIAAAVLLGVGLGAVGGFYARPGRTRGHLQPTGISNPVIHRIFTPGTVVNVVIGDASLVLIQDAVHSDISVAEYLRPDYADKLIGRASDPALLTTLRAVAHHGLTSLNNADVPAQCFRWGTISNSKVYIRYARYMHVRDFQQENFVIIGSRRSNPWTALFEPKLNFYLEEDPATHTFHFKDRKPKPGEPEMYAAQYDGPGVHIGYVDIAILPNLAGDGTVLLFNGLRMEDDEAASDAIFASHMPAALLRALGSATNASTIEVLLRVRSVGGAESDWTIASVHSGN